MILSIKTDYIGAIAGALCMIHCISTPFLFIIKSCSVACCEDTPVWWRLIDVAFLLISFYAIYHTSKKAIPTWLKTTFWLSWTILFLIIINEQINLFQINNKLIYIPGLLIITLHLYNIKFCRCSEKECNSNIHS